MHDLDTPLKDDELAWLDDFMTSRGAAEDSAAEAQITDPGLLNLFELDGFLTAMVSGPEFPKPSAWWPAVWGEDLPEWEDELAMMKVFGLVVRHMNSIADALMEDPEGFEPMFGEREFEGERYTIVDEWCRGYMHGVQLDLGRWLDGGEELMANLAPIMMFGTAKGCEQLNALPDAEVSGLREAIPDAVRALHGFWLQRREQASQPAVREGEKVGRNDPCPCGSGKKYKKCCLH